MESIILSYVWRFKGSLYFLLPCLMLLLVLFIARDYQQQVVPWWSLEDGTPIPWIDIDPLTGDISGTPYETGTYTFTARGARHGNRSEHLHGSTR